MKYKMQGEVRTLRCQSDNVYVTKTKRYTLYQLVGVLNKTGSSYSRGHRKYIVKQGILSGCDI